MRVILPIWGLKEKNGAKPKSELKEIELRYCHRSIRLKRAFKKPVKIG